MLGVATSPAVLVPLYTYIQTFKQLKINIIVIFLINKNRSNSKYYYNILNTNVI